MSSVDTSRFKNPYVHKVDTPARNMKGKGAPRSTVFGVLGQTKFDPYSRSLGGLVKHTADGKVKRGTVEKGRGMMTERDILGNISKTHTAGGHYGQILYAGRYMGAKGAEV